MAAGAASESLAPHSGCATSPEPGPWHFSPSTHSMIHAQPWHAWAYPKATGPGAKFSDCKMSP